MNIDITGSLHVPDSAKDRRRLVIFRCINNRETIVYLDVDAIESLSITHREITSRSGTIYIVNENDWIEVYSAIMHHNPDLYISKELSDIMGKYK